MKGSTTSILIAGFLLGISAATFAAVNDMFNMDRSAAGSRQSGRTPLIDALVRTWTGLRARSR